MKAATLAGEFAPPRGDPSPTQADGGGRSRADPLSRHEVLHGAWDQQVRGVHRCRGYTIKEWLANDALHTSDVDLRSSAGRWTSTTDLGRDTRRDGQQTKIAGRQSFCFTYDDGLFDVDIGAVWLPIRTRRIASFPTRQNSGSGSPGSRPGTATFGLSPRLRTALAQCRLVRGQPRTW